MNEADKKVFKQFVVEKFNIAPELIEEFKHTFIHKLVHTESAWQAALSHERERSKILVEALEFTSKACCYTDYEDSVQIAREALARYKGEA